MTKGNIRTTTVMAEAGSHKQYKLILIELCVLLIISELIMKIIGLNVNGLASSIPYIKQLCDSNDVIILTEHMLYPAQTYKLNQISPQHDVVYTCSDRLSAENCGTVIGCGGAAILYRNNLLNVTCLKTIQNDRMCGVRIRQNNLNIYVLGVYLPQQGCQFDSYDETLDLLEFYISECQKDGVVIVVGDMNAHVGTDVCPSSYRCLGVSTRQGRRLANMTKRNGCLIADLEPFANGPTYTYMSSLGHHSYIDHCIISLEVINWIKCVGVLEEDALNVSDHLPTFIEVDIGSEYCEQNSENLKMNSSKIKWDSYPRQEIHERYTKPLRHSLESIAFKYGIPLWSDVKYYTLERCLIDSFTDQVITAMRDTAESNMKKVKFKKWQKPYWTSELSRLSKDKKKSYINWTTAGRPRGDNPIWITYKGAKRDLRRQLRNAEYIHRTRLITKINDAEEADAKTFWRLLNSHNPHSKNKKCQPMRRNNGEITTDPNEIRNDWFRYFQILATPDPIMDLDIQDSDTLILEELNLYKKSTFNNADKYFGLNFDLDEVRIVQRGLALGKAGGWDSVAPEHAKYGGLSLAKMLQIIFNSIITHECVPANFKRGIVIPLYKGGQKDPSLHDNYRGITLKTIMSKVFEKLCLSRIKDAIQEDAIVSSLQGACRPGGSSLDVAFLVQETCHLFHEEGQPVKVALLDMKKAFDSVWLDGLFIQMYRSGLNGKAWRVISEYYNNYKCCVSYRGELSESYCVNKGVHQGGVLSMYLFTLFIGSALKDMLAHGVGCRYGDIKLACPAYADDVAIVAPYAKSTQTLINSMLQYCKKWHMELNPNKCVCIDICKGELGNVSVGRDVLDQVVIHDHVGVPVSKTLSLQGSDYIATRVSKARKKVNMFLGISTETGGINPITFSKLYNACILPGLLYGFHLLSISDQGKKLLSEFHITTAKRCQYLSRSTANIAATAQMGWLSMGSLIDKMRLLYIYHLISLPTKSSVKKLFINRFQQLSKNGLYDRRNSPVASIIKCTKQYGLYDKVSSLIVNRGIMSKKMWSNIVNETVLKFNNQLFKCNIRLYPSLKFYRSIVPCIRPNVWWKMSKMKPHLIKKARLIIRLLCNNSNLASHTCKFDKHILNSSCKLCSAPVEDLCHFLLVCPSVENLRKQMFDNILVLAKINISSFNHVEALHFLFCPTEEDLAECICINIHRLYIARLKLLDST